MVKIIDFDAKLHTKFIKATFKEAFPEYNPEELDRCLDLTNRWIARCKIAVYDNAPAGFMFYRKYPAFNYCEYIGVANKFRNKGVATEIIKNTCFDGQQWVFEVENNTGKSKNIFEKAGYFENPYHYDMPRADEINPGVEYSLWSKYPLSEKEFHEINYILFNDSDF